jgi:hypothetical protein
VNAIAVAGTNVYAGGDFTGGSGGPLAFHMARWDGSQWVSLNNASFTKVTTLATRTNDLFIAGYFGVTAANGTASWLTRWDGANFWSLVAFASNTFNVFYLDTIGFTGMAVTDTNIYLSGHTSMSECDDTLTICTNCDNVMRFDGTYCRVMGTGLSSNAVAIAAAGTNVYFAGAITNAGGVLVHGIACWNGTAWSDVGGGIVGPGRISALAVIGTNLYAGGTFTNVGGVPARCLARWDGNSWFALGRGTAFASGTGSVLALTTIGSDLYVGGIFDTVGGRDSRFVARWNEGLNFDGAALRLSQPAGGQNAPFSFALSAIGVPVYVIEGSTNLTVWSPLLTNSVTPYDFVDSNAPAFLRRFYRARSLP